MNLSKIFLLLSCLILSGCADYGINAARKPDLSSPEHTVRTFWTAIKAGDTNMALKCTYPERIATGHGGRNIQQFIDEHRETDTSSFQFLSGGSIRSPTHCMDYDMEKNTKDEWIIYSIHP